MSELRPMSDAENTMWHALPWVLLALWFIITSAGVWISAKAFWMTRKWGYFLFSVHFIFSLLVFARNEIARSRNPAESVNGVPVVSRRAVSFPLVPALLVTGVWLLSRRESGGMSIDVWKR